MSVKSQLPELSTILSSLHQEIKNMKAELENPPTFPKGELPPQLARLQNKLTKAESQLRKKSKDVLSNSSNKGRTVSSKEEGWGRVGMKLPSIMRATTQYANSGQEISKPISRLLLQQKHNALTANPQSDLGKSLLRNKFGIPEPLVRKERPLGGAGPTLASRLASKTIKPKRILSKEQRNDPFVEPPPITENDISEGMMSLVNRGIIPKDVDLTPAFIRGGAPFTLKPAKIFTRNEVRQQQLAIRQEVPPTQIVPPSIQIDSGPTFMTALKYDINQPSEKHLLKIGYMGEEEGQIMIHEDNMGGMMANTDIPTYPPPVIPQHPISKIEEERAGTYNELIDEYSMHQFIIRNGKVVRTSAEYNNFKRNHISIWGEIAYLMHKMERLLGSYNVPYAYVDGKRVARLAISDPARPSNQELFSCMINLDQIEEYTKRPQRMFRGTQGNELAAIYIQKNWRMFVSHREYHRTKFFKNRVHIIWNAYLLYKTKIKTRERISERRHQNMLVWREMMGDFKGKWGEIKVQRRIEIHINSYSIEEQKRLSMDKFLQRENTQISRIFAVKDPLVDVIYISPFTLPPEILGYYTKVLEIGEVENPTSRFTIITPENYLKFPSHLSTSTLLLYSPQAIRRIKSLIHGKQSYIVPGIVSHEDIKLSIALGVPIMSGEPQQSALYSTKSGSRRIFNFADVPIPIGGYDIYNIHGFEETLTRLILTHPHISTWVFKIDDEFNGRGHASLNIDSIKGLNEMRKKKVENIDHVLERGMNKVHEELPKRARIVMPSLYTNWTEYMEAFCKVGGVIEAAPNCPPSMVHSPSVSFFIEPDGNVQVLGSYDRFQSKEFVNAGCFFPQTALPNMNLLTISKAIGEALYQKGIIGHITLDLLAFPFPQNPNSHPLFWGIDLNCSLTDYAAVTYFFDFLMEGRLDMATGGYYIQQYPDEGDYKQEDAEEEPRHFMFSKYLNHPGLMSIEYKTFFHMCRLESISFDLEKRLGSTFLLSDSLESGILSVITIGEDKRESLRSMKEAINFIEQHAGEAPEKKADPANRVDAIAVNEVFMKIRMLAKLMEKKTKGGLGAALMADQPSKATYMSEMI